jgi:hypothetical protein
MYSLSGNKGTWFWRRYVTSCGNARIYSCISSCHGHHVQCTPAYSFVLNIKKCIKSPTGIYPSSWRLRVIMA